jgi:hypothetical protein
VTSDMTLARRFVEAFGTNDEEKLDALYSEDVVLYGPLSWPLRGRQALKDYIAQFLGAYGPVRIALHDEFYSPDGARACWRFTFHWQNNGEFFGHPPTGETGLMVETHTARLRDGLIVEQWVGDNSFQMPYMDLVLWQMDFPRDTVDPEPEIMSASVDGVVIETEG